MNRKQLLKEIQSLLDTKIRPGGPFEIANAYDWYDGEVEWVVDDHTHKRTRVGSVCIEYNGNLCYNDSRGNEIYMGSEKKAHITELSNRDLERIYRTLKTSYSYGYIDDINPFESKSLTEVTSYKEFNKLYENENSNKDHSDDIEKYVLDMLKSNRGRKEYDEIIKAINDARINLYYGPSEIDEGGLSWEEATGILKDKLGGYLDEITPLYYDVFSGEIRTTEPTKFDECDECDGYGEDLDGELCVVCHGDGVIPTEAELGEVYEIDKEHIISIILGSKLARYVS